LFVILVFIVALVTTLFVLLDQGYSFDVIMYLIITLSFNYLPFAVVHHIVSFHYMPFAVVIYIISSA
jgi:hypothetical protein